MDIVEKLDDCALSIGLEWPPHHRQYVFETMKAAKAEIEKLRATESRLRSLTAEMEAANAQMARVLELVDGALDNQVYGLKRSSSSDAYGRREAGLDLAPEYEHDVIITEALWDHIRKALARSALSRSQEDETK